MLAKKVFLNFIASAVDQVARIIVMLATTPILLSVLGDILFGYWQILQRCCNQLLAFDGRSSEALKWKISGKQEQAHDDFKKQEVGNALAIWGIFLPLLIIISVSVFSYLPSFIKVEQPHLLVAQHAGYIIIANLILLSATAIYEAILRGMNLGYKRIGLMAISTGIGGILLVVAAKNGLGLRGVVSAQVLTSMLYLVCFAIVVRNYVPWLGINFPDIARLKSAAKDSSWFMLWGSVSSFLYFGDAILLGVFANAALVTKYTVTMYAVQSASGVIAIAIAAALPGLGKVIGERNFEKAQAILSESSYYLWWIALSICSISLILNKGFVTLWVGHEKFSGSFENLLMIAAAMQLIFIRHNAAIINLAIDIKQKVIAGAAVVFSCVLLAAIFIPRFGIIGLCLAMIISRSFLTYYYPRVVQNMLKDSIHIPSRTHSVRIFVTAIIVVMISWKIGDYLKLETWTELFFMDH